jgi:hypothetical protein
MFARRDVGSSFFGSCVGAGIVGRAFDSRDGEDGVNNERKEAKPGLVEGVGLYHLCLRLRCRWG